MKTHRQNLALLLVPPLLALAGCKGPEWLQKGVHDGVELSYRWNHPAGKPTELLLRMHNPTSEDRAIDLAIDLYYQGRTVETLSADTCIRAGQTMTGKLNGIYFIPERVTTEQIKSGDAKAEVTRTQARPVARCPARGQTMENE